MLIFNERVFHNARYSDGGWHGARWTRKLVGLHDFWRG